MALSRKFLTALGIEADKVDEIIGAHSDTVNALKEERDKYKSQAEKATTASEELEDVKAKYEELKNAKTTSDSEWKTKFENLKTEFDTYKSDVEEKATKQTKTDAYKKLLKDAGISEKRIDSILKISSDKIDKLELEDDGSVKDSETIVKDIETEWADFKTTIKTVGANTATPPTNYAGAPKKESRAAQLANQYHNSIYGEAKKEG